jgi:hypothetical protein
MGIWHRLLARIDRRDLQSMLGSYRACALIYVAARLGIADRLEDGPMTGAELAEHCGAHAPSLRRVMRGLVAIGICREARDGRFSLTPMGEQLRTQGPRSLRGPALLMGEEYYPAWGDLMHSAMTGEPAFRHVFGMSQWEHRAQHPELGESFDAGMERGTERSTGAILAAYDFSRFGTVADVGGGRGVLLAALLQAHPALSGILVEQPHVVEAACGYLEAAGVAGRCRVVAGSFFEALPEGADAHILKSIIHDWDDERALAILRNCHVALKPQSKLLLVEQPVAGRPGASPIMLDLQMLVVAGGRERTIEEHCELLRASGFRLEHVIPTRSHLSILEAARL